jgi:hypothetical protein
LDLARSQAVSVIQDRGAFYLSIKGYS